MLKLFLKLAAISAFVIGIAMNSENKSSENEEFYWKENPECTDPDSSLYPLPDSLEFLKYRKADLMDVICEKKCMIKYGKDFRFDFDDEEWPKYQNCCEGTEDGKEN